MKHKENRLSVLSTCAIVFALMIVTQGGLSAEQPLRQVSQATKLPTDVTGARSEQQVRALINIEAQIYEVERVGQAIIQHALKIARGSGDITAINTLVAAELNMRKEIDAAVWSLDQIPPEELVHMADLVASFGLSKRLLEASGVPDDVNSHFGCGADPTPGFIAAKLVGVVAQIVVWAAPGDVYAGACVGVVTEACSFVLVVAPLKLAASVVATAAEIAASVLGGLVKTFEDCEHAEAVDHLALKQAVLEDKLGEIQDSIIDLAVTQGKATPTLFTPACHNEDGLLDALRQKVVISICDYLALGESSSDAMSSHSELEKGDDEVGISTPSFGTGAGDLCASGSPAAPVAIPCPTIPGSYVEATKLYLSAMDALTS